MLKALIRKQFDECFRSYFVNRKTGKANSKLKVAGMFILFSVLMVFLGSFSFGMGMAMDYGLSSIPFDIHWMYYTVFGAVAILFGVFGSVFNTYAALYLPKDNESLLAMPIKPSTILVSRLVLVYLLSLMYSGIVWLPCIIAAAVAGHSSVTGMLLGILLMLVLALLVTVITCALGWVVALIATRVRSKSFLTVLLVVSFLGLYYVFCFNLETLMNQLISNIAFIALGVQKWGGPLYTLGLAGMGDLSSVLIFCGITFALTAVLLFVMIRSYMPMLLKKPKEAKAKARMDKSVKQSVRKALLMRDMKRFTSSSTYMLNSALSVILMPILVIMVLVKLKDLPAAMEMITQALPGAAQLIPIALSGIVAILMGMNAISLPSVSLEGKTLWILQTLPLTGWLILRSKRDLHILINAVPTLICTVILDVIFGASLAEIAVTALFILVFIWFTADYGLMLGVRHADLKWTNETIVIKQNMWILVIMAVSLVVVAVIGAGVYFLLPYVKPLIVLLVSTLLLGGVTVLLEKWLRSKGAAMVETL